jgi:hypothetical protein
MTFFITAIATIARNNSIVSEIKKLGTKTLSNGNLWLTNVAERKTTVVIANPQKIL